MNAYHRLAQFGKELLKHPGLDETLPIISAYAKEIIGAERCSVYIYDSKQKRVWTVLADGIERIEFDADLGIVGVTIQTRECIIENHPYDNPSFNQDIDHESGYKTESLLSIPIFSSTNILIGVLQLLNKPNGFDDEDLRFTTFFAHYASSYLELAIYYEKENRSGAKERVG